MHAIMAIIWTIIALAFVFGIIGLLVSCADKKDIVSPIKLSLPRVDATRTPPAPARTCTERRIDAIARARSTWA